MRKILAFLAISLLTWSCNTREVEVPADRLGYNFFPLQIGQYAVYDVEQTTYSLTAPPATVQYQIKEVVADTFTDLSHDKAFLIHRFTRSSDQVNWKVVPDSVWTAKIKGSQAIRTENNVSFIKLTFPIKESLTWNGNALNDRGKDDYQISGLDKPFVLPSRTFDHTVSVIQQNDSNLVNNDQQIEVFARETGLIYKERYQVQYCGANPLSNCTSVGQIDFGVRYIQRIREYGKE